jgi:hypothetical protein
MVVDYEIKIEQTYDDEDQLHVQYIVNGAVCIDSINYQYAWFAADAILELIEIRGHKDVAISLHECIWKIERDPCGLEIGRRLKSNDNWEEKIKIYSDMYKNFRKLFKHESIKYVCIDEKTHLLQIFKQMMYKNDRNSNLWGDNVVILNNMHKTHNIQEIKEVYKSAQKTAHLMNYIVY